jgi:hypothetical protein
MTQNFSTSLFAHKKSFTFFFLFSRDFPLLLETHPFHVERQFFISLFLFISIVVALPSGLPDNIFFRPKIAIWVNFGGSYNRKYLYILWTFAICMYFVDICSILWTICILRGNLVYFPHFGIFSPFWYIVPKKIWQLGLPSETGDGGTKWFRIATCPVHNFF